MSYFYDLKEIDRKQPGGVEHSVQNLGGWSLALDLFSPPREEYKKLVVKYFDEFLKPTQ